jgi:hypothetical protein
MTATIHVNDKMQQDYTYQLSAPMGKAFDPEFKPELTPKEMLALGIFGGVYMRDCIDEFPSDWFESAVFAEDKRDPELNYFQVNASQSLKEWIRKGWIYEDDPRGWFQWYCRYYMGRRLPDEDSRQIKRWKNMTRHTSQIKKYCAPGDLACRRRQRQAVLHWAYDSRKI